MSKVIERQPRQRFSIDTLSEPKPEGLYGGKMLVFQNPEVRAKKIPRPDTAVQLDAKLTVMSLKPIKAIDPEGHSNESCPDASCPRDACVTPQTGTQAKSCCIDCS